MVAFKSLGLIAVIGFSAVQAQTFRRSAACPTLGCIYPPDQTDFIAGGVFDIRLEAQAPFNGSQVYNKGVPNPVYSLTIEGPFDHKEKKSKNGAMDVSKFFKLNKVDNKVVTEAYNFTYFEDLFAQDAKKPTLVFVNATTIRHVALYEPGHYVATFTYNGGATTVANWFVEEIRSDKAPAKNVILFVGDGMTTAMITAARLLGHKSINGKYQTTMAMDKAPGYGSQHTHSLDSFITDSANSATALMSGKKSTVNALNAYTDSTGKPFNDPKMETIFEMFRRITGGRVGVVSTAYIADATPAAVVAHTSQRSQYDAIIEQFLNGVTATFPWTKWTGVDVLFGAGAEYFLPRKQNNMTDVYAKWSDRGYSIVHDNTSLHALDNSKPALGMFCQSNLPVWLDRNVYKTPLNTTVGWNGTKGTFDLPGLKDMTIKAIDILQARSKSDGKGKKATGWMLMSEAASIDKQMHALDYDRALGDLLELDATIKATLIHLKEIGELENTLVVVTSDHGHGFDVFGSADTKYLAAQKTDREKREAIGTYLNSGLSEYQVSPGSLPDNATVVYNSGANFPVQWSPRYTIAGGMAANPDHREDYAVNTSAPRVPAINDPSLPVNSTIENFFINPLDSPDGFIINGTLPVESSSGVHSLTDVAVYSWGPGHELFRGVYNSPDIALKIAFALGLGRTSNITMY